MAMIMIIMISNYQQQSFHSMKEKDPRVSYVGIQDMQEGFTSERNETHSTIGDHHDFDQHRDKEFHIKYHVQNLLTHFKHLFDQKGFKVTEVFPGKIMLVKLTLCDRINYIFLNKEPQRYLLTITTQEYKSVRKLRIKSLGYTHHHRPDFDEIQQLYQMIEENPLPAHLVEEEQNNRDETEAGAEYRQDLYSLEATSTYMYHKIFVDRNYSMGKKMRKLLESTGSEDIIDMPKDQALLAIGGIREITDDMLKNFNCTRKELLEILCHCRKTVEDFYLDRTFLLPSRDQLEQYRGTLEASILDKIPQTVKAFQRILEQTNSTSLLRTVFLCHFVFDLQCELLKYSENEKLSLGQKLGSNFVGKLRQKMKLLGLWGYSRSLAEAYLVPFLG